MKNLPIFVMVRWTQRFRLYRPWFGQTGSRFWVRSLYLVMLAAAPHAQANIPCDLTGACRTASVFSTISTPRAMQRAAEVEYTATRTRTELSQRTSFTRAEYEAFSGIGAIVCTAAGERRASTAFLVGGFDIAVTVAHMFERNGHWASPTECLYTSIGSDGTIRERIPLASIRAQWQIEPETFGRPASDVAVVRLSSPVQLAQRTMSFTQFDDTHAPVVLVGFRPDLVTDARRRKARGQVYPRGVGACAQFAHDVDSRGVAAGAPLIDVRDGVVLGIHTRLAARPLGHGSRCTGRGNAMIRMNDWLERTLHAEIDSSATERAVGQTESSTAPR